MPTFRNRPVPYTAVMIEARQWHGSFEWPGEPEIARVQDNETIAWVARTPGVSRAWRRETDRGQDLIIQTQEWSTATIKPGWWVIRSASGEFRGCAPEIFRSVYEPVAETEAGPVEVSLEAANGAVA